MKNHNLFVFCNIFCIVLFIAIPIYVIIWKDWEIDKKALTTLACSMVILYLTDALMEAIKSNNRPF